MFLFFVGLSLIFLLKKKIIENIDRDLSYDLEGISLLWQSQKTLALRPSQDSYYMIIPNSQGYQGRIAEGAIFPGNIIFFSRRLSLN